MKNTILFLNIIILFSCGGDKIHKTAAKKNNIEIPGQSAAPDMVFIPGTGKHIPSFYASVAEEPNINYVVYLKWLSHIYAESYPEIIEKALPKNPEINSSYEHNDPYLSAYTTHPAFAYYPVVNLTWEQIDHYLAWKTDRLNETILIRTGIINLNPDQKDEDCFNTESYLAGQYEGSVRRNMYDVTTGGERSVTLGDGILFTGFRLPTEEEWEHMSQERFQKKEILKDKKIKDLSHPYGDDYFTLPYGRIYGDAGSYSYGSRTLPLGFSSYQVDPKFFAKTDYDFGKEKNENGKEGIKSIYNYDSKSYGLINMKDGVQEWVLDEYQEGKSNKGLGWKEVMKKGGFNVDDAAQKSGDGQYVQKAFLGRMRDFRFIGINANGNPNEIGIYAPHIDTYYLSEEDKLNPPIENPHPRTRVIKGGTSENPSLGSSYLKESEASPNVGFRTILPYTGQPVVRGHKVKWGKKQQIKY